VTVYATIDEADAILTDSSEWTSASDANKTLALSIASKWIDSKYTCTFTSPVQDDIIRATSLLADLYIKETLFTPLGGAVEAIDIKAGPVSISEKYSDAEQPEDPFSEIKLLLATTDCSENVSIEFVRV